MSCQLVHPAITYQLWASWFGPDTPEKHPRRGRRSLPRLDVLQLADQHRSYL